MTLSQDVLHIIQDVSKNRGGIFLENAQVDDLGHTLTLRGMIPVPRSTTTTTTSKQEEVKEEHQPPPLLHGVLYHPAFLTFTQQNQQLGQEQENNDKNNKHPSQQQHKQQDDDLDSLLTPFEWNYSLLKATKQHDPIFHCYGLHEWAMLYPTMEDTTKTNTNHQSTSTRVHHPLSSPPPPPPPSSMFQSHIPLRVSSQIIEETIQTRGTNCTHFDALRFFTPTALPFNTPAYTDIVRQRSQQVMYEQPACVHANMDLFKIALRLQPFIASSLIVEALQVALISRTLDVEASPYDVSSFGLGFVPVETSHGRALYKKRQVELMHQGNIVRTKLIAAYETFLSLIKSVENGTIA